MAVLNYKASGDCMEVNSKIENFVRKMKESEELKKWVEEIKKNVFWEIKY